MTPKVKELLTDLQTERSLRLVLHPVEPERWLYEVYREDEEIGEGSGNRVRILAPPKAVVLRDM